MKHACTVSSIKYTLYRMLLAKWPNVVRLTVAGYGEPTFLNRRLPTFWRDASHYNCDWSFNCPLLINSFCRRMASRCVTSLSRLRSRLFSVYKFGQVGNHKSTSIFISSSRACKNKFPPIFDVKYFWCSYQTHVTWIYTGNWMANVGTMQKLGISFQPHA